MIATVEGRGRVVPTTPAVAVTVPAATVTRAG
jgi:hypothetical protein